MPREYLRIFVNLNRTVQNVRNHFSEIDGSGEVLNHIQHGRESGVYVNFQNVQKDISFILEISVNDACGYTRAFCDFRSVGVVVSRLREKLKTRLYDSVLFSIDLSCFGSLISCAIYSYRFERTI